MAHEILVSAQGLLVLGLGLKGLGPGLDNRPGVDKVKPKTWLGLGLVGFGTKGLGPRLENIEI